LRWKLEAIVDDVSTDVEFDSSDVEFDAAEDETVKIEVELLVAIEAEEVELFDEDELLEVDAEDAMAMTEVVVVVVVVFEVDVVVVDDIVDELEAELVVEVVELDVVVVEDVLVVMPEGAYQSNPLSLSFERLTSDAVVAPYDSLSKEPAVVVTSEYEPSFVKMI